MSSEEATAGGDIVLGSWLYDEKEPPDLSLQNEWRRKVPSRKLGKQGEAVAVSRDLLKSGHTHIRGKTGSGKSSRLVLPLIKQLMQPYVLTWTAPDGERQSQEERDAIVVIDIGGDKSLFHATKAFADSDPSRTFSFLALDPNHSQKFDPFQCIPEGSHRIIRLCNLFIESFSLDHGLIYGGSYYSQRNLQLMLSVCERLMASKRGGKELTLFDVDRYLQDADSASVRDAEQLRGIFRFLLQYPQLQPAPGEKNLIDMRKAIANREVVYAFLPSISEATTARQLAGLMLYTTVNAAMTLYEKEEEHGAVRPQPHVHVFADEFQQLAGPSFESLLTGARKYSLSMYMANQTTESLQKRDLDLSAAVRDNCSLRLYQTVTGKRDIEELLTFSRESTRTLKSKRTTGKIQVHGKAAFGGDSTGEHVTTQLSKSEILDISSSAGSCLAIIEDGLGHREPIPLQTEYVLTPGEYLKYRSTPLPTVKHLDSAAGRHGTVVSSMPPWKASHLAAVKSKEHQARLERFEGLRQRLEDGERG